VKDALSKRQGNSNHCTQFAPSGQGRGKQRRAPGANRSATMLKQLSHFNGWIQLLCSEAF